MRTDFAGIVRHVFALVVPATMALMFVTTAAAQAPTNSLRPRQPRLLGVYDADTGEPIEGADVVDVASRISARTTKTGTISLGFIDGDGSLVRITKVGYKPAAMMVRTGVADTVPLTVVLARDTPRLPVVVTRDSAPTHVSAGLRSFEERRRTSVGGQFITTAELRKADNRKLSDVMRRLNGMSLQCTKPPAPPMCFPVSTRQTARLTFQGGVCYADMYLNGALISEGSNPLADSHNIDDFAVQDLAAIEFYAGAASIPPEFNKTGSPCGVLLLWSREE